MKPFSDAEKHRLRGDLLNNARELFERWGFKKTSVDDITRRTGIARGSFYAFFASKEEVFLALLRSAETEIQTQIVAHLADETKSVEESLSGLLRTAYATLETHPLLRFAHASDREFESIVRGLSDEQRRQMLEEDESTVLRIMDHFERRGRPLNATVSEFTALLRHAATTVLSRDSIGREAYAPYVEWLVRSQTSYLLSKEKR